MIITESQIQMDSKHQLKSRESRRSVAVIQRADKSVQFDCASSNMSLTEQLMEHQMSLEAKQLEEQLREYREHLQEAKKNHTKNSKVIKTKHQLKTEVMQCVMNMVRRIINGEGDCSFCGGEKMQNLICDNEYTPSKEVIFTQDKEENLPSGTWTKTVVKSFYYKETENTAYSSTGTIKCADGREIDFGITMELSRTFCETYEEFVQRDIVVLDPLVINFQGTSPDVSDMKFMFDLNSDGELEEISSLGSRSGFLALDKNCDGIINNGTELFGTQSGNGFADLSVYDEDGNGWIDEADKVYKDLVVWTKDEKGQDKIVSMKEADVGAIYLGYASTEYTYRGEHYNEADAVLRNTGIYMKESGEVGTVSHIDFAV